MRTIEKKIFQEAIKQALIEMNHELSPAFISRLASAKETETGTVSKTILDDILQNHEIARKGTFPLCQDTGMVVVFADVGQEVYFSFDFESTLNEAVAEAYAEGYLRKSIVDDPIHRRNSETNTPAITHIRLVPGDQLRLRIAAKGGGSENMSTVRMLKPNDGLEGVRQETLKAIKNAGGRPCPPLIVGIGLGGNLEKSALLAKEAILRDIDDKNPDPELAQFEQQLETEINELDVGPMGVGGETTCLAVKVNTFPTHIAMLPFALNLQCHAARHREVVL